MVMEQFTGKWVLGEEYAGHAASFGNFMFRVANLLVQSRSRLILSSEEELRKFSGDGRMALLCMMAAAGEGKYERVEGGELLKTDVFADLVGNCGWVSVVSRTAEELMERQVGIANDEVTSDGFYRDTGYLAALHMQPWYVKDENIPIEEIRAAVLRIGMFMGVLKLEKQPLLAHNGTTQPAFAQA